MRTSHGRAALVFVALFVLYQSAEGVGDLWLHNFTVQATLMVACVVAAWPLSRWLGFRGYGAYALQVQPRWLVWLIGGLALAALAKLAAVAVGMHMNIYEIQAPANPQGGFALLAAIPMLLVATFVPSLAEDILTRGFWYRAAGIRWRSGVVFVTFSSGMYLLNHIYRLQNGPELCLMLFCYGLAYATALWRSGNLWAAVGLHWGWNLTNAFLDTLLPMRALDASAGWLLSAAANLGMVLVLLALPSARGAKRASSVASVFRHL